MKHTLIVATALAALATTAPALASSASDADALLPAALRIEDAYQRGLAKGWLEIAARQDSSVLVSDTYNDAAPKALQNARHFIDGSQPFVSIYGQKHWPAASRPAWIEALQAIERVNEKAAKSSCRLESAGRLSVLTDEVWKEQDETHGTRWNHGWAQIERARKLAQQVERDLGACPVPVSAEAPPAPKPVKPEPIRLSADALFDFDKAQLKPQGQEAVRRLAEQIQAADEAEVIVTGYTDRLGSPAHNLQLSRARAQAVAQALIAAGVLTKHMQVEGKGAAEPTTNCPGRATPAVISCLAPDRRVEIRVTGASR